MKSYRTPAGCWVEFKISYEPHPEQQDAIWYQGEGCIASVSYKGFAVDIYCDGDMRITNRETEEVYRSPSDLLSAGFDTDKQLSKATEDEILDWDMNSWFDMYCEGEHLDAVTHELHEAIGMAETYLLDESKNEELLMLDFQAEV